MNSLVTSVAAAMLEMERALERNLRSGVPTADDIVNYVISSGGKRVRPLLFLLSADLAGFSDILKLSDIAAAIEIFHCASLMHDDVIDNSSVRRGRPSPRVRWGNDMSVIVGDFMWSRASRMITAAGNTRLIDVMSQAAEEAAMGEVIEAAHRRDITTDAGTYMKIISGKTAALFCAAAKAGAVAAKAHADVEDALANFGRNLGLAFQLMDDVRDYLEPEAQSGKERFSDCREGRLTYPMISALAKAGVAEASEMGALLARRTNDGSAKDKLSAFIKRHDGFADAMNRARRHTEDAKQCFERLPVSPKRNTLFEFADCVITLSA